MGTIHRLSSGAILALAVVVGLLVGARIEMSCGRHGGSAVDQSRCEEWIVVRKKQRMGQRLVEAVVMRQVSWMMTLAPRLHSYNGSGTGIDRWLRWARASQVISVDLSPDCVTQYGRVSAWGLGV